MHPDHQMTQKSFLRSPLSIGNVVSEANRYQTISDLCHTSSSKGQAPPLPGFGPWSDLPSTSAHAPTGSRPSMGGFCRLAFLRITLAATTAPNWALRKSWETKQGRTRVGKMAWSSQPTSCPIGESGLHLKLACFPFLCVPSLLFLTDSLPPFLHGPERRQNHQRNV